MVEVKKHGVLLEPTTNAFEEHAVLNPGVFQDGDTVHLFYRAVDKEFQSCVGYARLEGPTNVVERWDKPFMTREKEYESKGVEDPRIVKIDDTFYCFYVAHDGKNAITAYATGTDLMHLTKQGLISPRIEYREAEKLFAEAKLKDSYTLFSSFYKDQAGEDVLLWHKDVFLFPKKINGQFALIHRILPEMQILFFDDFKQLTDDYWRKHIRNLSEYVVLENKHWFESRNNGGGAPPVETKDGWLVIFHAVEARNKGRVYHAGAALLDKTNPLKVVGKLHEPLFSPAEEWEKKGFVSNVVFPTGTALFDDTLYIYYGAADMRIAVASVSMRALLRDLQDPTKEHSYGKEQK